MILYITFDKPVDPETKFLHASDYSKSMNGETYPRGEDD